VSTIGVDLGTSGVRAVAYDDQGHQIAAATEKTSLNRPQEGWVVIDAEAVLNPRSRSSRLWRQWPPT
jgi:xylulokinase